MELAIIGLNRRVDVIINILSFILEPEIRRNIHMSFPASHQRRRLLPLGLLHVVTTSRKRYLSPTTSPSIPIPPHTFPSTHQTTPLHLPSHYPFPNTISKPPHPKPRPPRTAQTPPCCGLRNCPNMYSVPRLRPMHPQHFLPTHIC